MTQRGAWYIIHYIDDFLTVGALGSNECDRIMHEIDSRDMELRLPGEKLVHITTKELVPIVLETALWGKEWQGQAVQIWCDNAAVVSVINQGSSRDKQAMHLTRCLAFIKAKFELELVAAHISGANNTKPDALSRNKLSLFHCLHPQTNSKPTNIREALLDLLLVSKPDWMSQHWENLWTSIFLTVSRPRWTYDAAKKRYASFCKASGTQPLLASESLLCMFVSYLANDQLCHSTIGCYLAAIRHWHIAESMGDPGISNMTRLEQALKGIRLSPARTVSREGPAVPRLPLTPALLAKMKGVWKADGDEWKHSMLWATAALCFFGFFQSGEITVPSENLFDEGAHPMFDEIQIDCLSNSKHLKVIVKASKTDQYRVGTEVFVSKTSNQLCPVAAVLTYIMVKKGKGPGPFFKWQNGKPLTRVRFVTEVKQALTKAGADACLYAGHSFRRGAATAAAKQGVWETTIKMLGRWKSSAYQRVPRDQLAMVTPHLAESSKMYTCNNRSSNWLSFELSSQEVVVCLTLLFVMVASQITKKGDK